MSSKITKLLLGAGAIALLPAGQAWAAGTAAGTDVSNTFTLSYDVGGTPQTYTPDADDTVVFEVDRVIDLTTAVVSGDPLTATPGQAVQQVFEVTNTGNAPQAYDLNIFQNGTDAFDTTPTSIEISIDGGPFVTYTPGDPTPDVPADSVLTVRVNSTVPLTTNAGDSSEIALVADTLEPAAGNFGTAGTPINASDGTNTQGGVETVLADGAGDLGGTTGGADVAEDGNFADTATINVEDATIEAVKSVALFSEDGSNCANLAATATATTSDFYIPGACVEYTITLTNSGTADATNVDLSDILQDTLIFDAADTTLTGGTFSPPAAANTACDGTATTCEVAYADGTVPAPVAPATSTTRVIRIRARVK